MDIIFSFIAEQSVMLAIVIVACIFGGLVYRYHNSIQNLKNRVNEHSGMLQNLSVWVMKKDKAMIDVLAVGFSPIRLKPPGMALLEVSGGKRCIDDNLDFFMKNLKKRAPMTPFDVQESSRAVVFGNFNLPIFNTVKHFLYFKPEDVELAGEKVEASMFTVTYVMGVYLRDMYLEKHPEIMPKTEEIYANE